jgi:putative heme iron utilization protein
MGGGSALEQDWGMERGEVMSSPTVTEVSRLSAHRREVALVRQSLLSGMQSREQAAQQVSRLTR